MFHVHCTVAMHEVSSATTCQGMTSKPIPLGPRCATLWTFGFAVQCSSRAGPSAGRSPGRAPLGILHADDAHSLAWVPRPAADGTSL